MFEKLYKEFEDECEGTVYMMVNNPNRYKKWYKERVEQLCIDYKQQTRTPDWCPLEDARAWCPNCGKEFDSCGNCEAIFRTLPPGIGEE